MNITPEQKDRLTKLIELARKNGDKIVAVNEEFDAYCPEDGIFYPDYEWVLRNMTDHPPYSKKIVMDVIGTEDDWAEKLKKVSFYGFWVNWENERIFHDEAGVEDGNCSKFGIYYTELDLPSDVRPIVDPFVVESKKWQAVVGK